MSQICDNLDIYQRIQKKTLENNILFRADWDLTSRCNLKCVHCYQTESCLKRELETYEIFSVLDQLASLNCLTLTFTGGEIILRRDFFDIARYARKKEFALVLFSNGTLIDEETADKIKAISPVSVHVSLYGMTAQVHDEITQVPGSFKKTMNAFTLLKKRSVTTTVKYTVMKSNLAEFDNVKEFAEKEGLRFLFSCAIIPKIDGCQEVLSNRLNEDELKHLFDLHPWIVKGIKKGGVRVYKPLCAAGVNTLFISSCGDVFPCVALREYCGNVRESSLKEIWGNQVFRKIRNISFEDLRYCGDCEFSYYCDRCNGSALLEGRDLLGCCDNDYVLAKVRKWAVEDRKQKTEDRGQNTEDRLIEIRSLRP